MLGPEPAAVRQPRAAGPDGHGGVRRGGGGADRGRPHGPAQQPQQRGGLVLQVGPHTGIL